MNEKWNKGIAVIILSLCSCLTVKAQEIGAAASPQATTEARAALSEKEIEAPGIVITGEVVNPGKLELRERMTALQALRLAGGLTETAKAGQLLIVRQTDGALEARVVNLRFAVQRGGQVDDLALRPGDLLWVPKTTISDVDEFLKTARLELYFKPLHTSY